MWNLPGPGIEPVSPALAGGFLPTASPGKSLAFILLYSPPFKSDLKIFWEAYLTIRTCLGLWSGPRPSPQTSVTGWSSPWKGDWKAFLWGERDEWCSCGVPCWHRMPPWMALDSCLLWRETEKFGGGCLFNNWAPCGMLPGPGHLLRAFSPSQVSALPLEGELKMFFFN